MTLEEFEKSLKEGKIYNSYIFYGIDEKQIKDAINLLVEEVIDKNFKDLNYMRMDGLNLDIDSFINVCETLPFISEKKVVEIFRAEDLRVKSSEKPSKAFKDIISYMKDMPSYSIGVAYYIFQDKREKNRELDKLKGNICAVKVDELKGDRLYKKIQKIFYKKGKDIGKIELRYFAEKVDNDLNIIEMEVDKLISYTEGREIKKADIDAVFPISNNDDDIFDLVDAISSGRTQKALMICNDIIFKGAKETAILSMIERQFDLLLKGKAKAQNRETPDEFSKAFGLHPYVAKNLMEQSKRFSEKQLKQCLTICLTAEEHMKFSTGDNKMELEMSIINCARAKK
ncbi:DNA polymerase III subunit delta [Clostridium sp.]|uniref:DNA polymerase III subunit delta n=1 Tax=Clostridium sp. TaxID=1506 RepID=UPI0034643075